MRLVTGDVITFSAYALIMSIVGVVTVPDWGAVVACGIIAMFAGGLAISCYKENRDRAVKRILWGLEQL